MRERVIQEILEKKMIAIVRGVDEEKALKVARALCAGGVTLLVLWNYEFWDAPTQVERYRILANAFTIPGVILMMVAALTLMRKKLDKTAAAEKETGK